MYIRHDGDQQGHSYPLLQRVLLRCTSDRTLEVTISPGMLESVMVLHDAINAAIESWPCPRDAPQCNPDSASCPASLFTTHWLHNRTGSRLEFWTSWQSLGVRVHQRPQVPGIHVAESEELVPLRAVALGHAQAEGKLPVSLTELSFALPAGSSIHSVAVEEKLGAGIMATKPVHETVACLNNEETPWFAEDFAHENGSASDVNVKEDQHVEEEEEEEEKEDASHSKRLQDFPGDKGVVASGFSGTAGSLPNNHGSSQSHRRLHLYFQLEGQVCACGPVALDVMGTTNYVIDISSSPNSAGQEAQNTASSPLMPSARMKANVVCDVTCSKMSGFNIELHSDMNVVNETTWRVEVGCWAPGWEEARKVQGLHPGDGMWLPVATAVAGEAVQLVAGATCSDSKAHSRCCMQVFTVYTVPNTVYTYIHSI